MRAAVIGIGSNSLRMLLADVVGDRLTRLKRYREGLRTFAALDANGNIAPEMIAQSCDHVRAFAAEARGRGAETVCMFATSAVRDAKNKADFAAALEEASGVRLEVCSGELEARLSFIGATNGESAGLIDIGGGSTELAAGQGATVGQSVSLQMGAVRLYRMQPIVDVATAFKVVQMAREILSPVVPAFRREGLEHWIGVGGTFTTSAALAQSIPWDNRERLHQYMLSREKLEDLLRRLAPMPVEQRLTLPSLQPQRADIVVHGIAILLACMKELQIPMIQVSECGNLEGYLKVKYMNCFKAERNP